MTREEQLKSCRICKKQRFDANQGIICSTTGSHADFEVACHHFEEDQALKARYDIIPIPKSTSKGKRLANYLLDSVFLVIISMCVWIFLARIVVSYVPEYVWMFEQEDGLRDYLIGFVIAMLYYSLFEGLTGRTLAKFITGTKVVNEKGEKPGLYDVLIRSISRFVPLEWISIFLSDDKTMWHDSWSKTHVVDVVKQPKI